MSCRKFYVGPAWPPPLNAYDYVLTLDEPDCAWEFLRRCPAYQCAARLDWSRRARPFRHASGVVMFRMRGRCRRAEAWQVLSFRRPLDPRPPCARRLARP